jgi:hypothetical protein
MGNGLKLYRWQRPPKATVVYLLTFLWTAPCLVHFVLDRFGSVVSYYFVCVSFVLLACSDCWGYWFYFFSSFVCVMHGMGR